MRIHMDLGNETPGASYSAFNCGVAVPGAIDSRAELGRSLGPDPILQGSVGHFPPRSQSPASLSGPEDASLGTGVISWARSETALAITKMRN